MKVTRIVTGFLAVALLAIVVGDAFGQDEDVVDAPMMEVAEEDRAAATEVDSVVAEEVRAADLAAALAVVLAGQHKILR